MSHRLPVVSLKIPRAEFVRCRPCRGHWKASNHRRLTVTVHSRRFCLRERELKRESAVHAAPSTANSTMKHGSVRQQTRSASLSRRSRTDTTTWVASWLFACLVPVVGPSDRVSVVPFTGYCGAVESQRGLSAGRTLLYVFLPLFVYRTVRLDSYVVVSVELCCLDVQ